MSGFAAAGLLVVLAALLVAAVYVLGAVLAVTCEPLTATPFAGGLPPTEHALSRFHVRWYAASMLFLAFDMEMIFMYPWVRVITSIGASAVIEMFAFLAILVAGIVYAWREGALRWA